MSLMKKINENIERNKSLGENDIYRKFNKQFEKLFNAKESTKTKQDFESIYVNDHEFEQEIKNFTEAETHTIRFCVGYTGIGKSTTIRHCFKLGMDNGVFIGQKEVVFPSFFDGYQVSDIEKFDLSIRIASVCTCLEDKHPDLRSLMRTYDGKKEFFDFIKKHTGFILENIDPVKAMDMDEEELIKEKLHGAYQKNSYEFHANKLKFYLKKKYHLYNHLIIILDDIESLPENKQIEIIAKYLKFHECMQNTDFPEEGDYYIKILISVRPQTYSSVRGNPSIEAFPIGEYPILKRKSVSLDSLFEKRFKYYTKKYAKSIGNQDSWDACYRELMSMNQAFEGQYKDMISNLCFMNIREALSSYSKVFANRYWVQRNKLKEESFTISSSEYSFNNINVIRALACNEERAFWGDTESVIPNIFYTTKKDDLSVFCLLVISYFVERKGIEYGMNAESFENIKEEWRTILGSDILINMQYALEFLFKKKIICKSVLDSTSNNENDTLSQLSDQSLLYISPRGNEMFAMFSRDSVLLEMLRENAWRDYEDKDYSDQCSSDLMKLGKQDEIFKDLLEYIDFLYETENYIRGVVKKVFHKETEYENAFGYYPVVYHLLMGVKNSMEYSGYISIPLLADKYNTLNDKINNLIRF